MSKRIWTVSPLSCAHQSLSRYIQFINKFTRTNNTEDSILLELDVMLVRLEDKDTKDRAAV